jgi:hypothetical protein
MPIPAAVIVAAGLAGVGYAVNRGLAHRDWSGVRIGEAEPGYRWDDSDGDWGIEVGQPPHDGTHPRKPGRWDVSG